MTYAAAVIDWSTLGSFHLDTRPRGRCPNPQKQAFPTGYQVVDAFADLLERDSQLGVYECVCGSWHAGHERDRSRRARPYRVAREQRRVKNRIDDATFDALLELKRELGDA